MDIMPHLQWLDWLIIIGYLVFSFSIGMLVKDTASAGVEGFFVAGRGMNWMVVGASLIATTFACDTPLVISGWVANLGISGNWFWWSGVISMVALTVFFARKWRSSGVVTDVELTEMRYGGRPATVLRSVKAAFSATIVNWIILSWIFAAMAKIAKTVVHWDVILGESTYKMLVGSIPAVFILKDFDTTMSLGLVTLVVVAYCMHGGLKAVIITDLFQFGLALFAAYLIGWIAVEHVGGLSSMWTQLKDLYPAATFAGGDSYFSTAKNMAGDPFLSWYGVSAFIPSFDEKSIVMPLDAFILALGIMWWTNGGIDGSGFTAQRLFTAKDEISAEKGSLLFAMGNFLARHWPWVLAGLAALVLYPRQSGDFLARMMTSCQNGAPTCTEQAFADIKAKDPIVAKRYERVTSVDAFKQCADVPGKCFALGIPDFDLIIRPAVGKETNGILEYDGLNPIPTELRIKDLVQAKFAELLVKNPQLAAYYATNMGQFTSAAGKVSVDESKLTKAFVFKEDREMAYPLMIRDVMPMGLMGLCFASLMAAFMSTVSTMINWGASYATNDFYYRLINPKATQKQLTLVSKITTVIIAVVAVYLGSKIENIGDMWFLWAGLMSGLGMPHILRWLWWRANAWTEITGLVVGILWTVGDKYFQITGKILHGIGLGGGSLNVDHVYYSICMTAFVSGVVAIIVTYLTKPVSEEQLQIFVNKVEPMGWWKGLDAKIPRKRSVSFAILLWMVGSAAIYIIMFGMGYVVRTEYALGCGMIAAGSVLTWLLIKGLERADKVKI